jgi:hypothetical protein
MSGSNSVQYDLPTGKNTQGKRIGDSHAYDGNPEIQNMIKDMGVTKAYIDEPRKQELFGDLKRKIGTCDTNHRMKNGALMCIDTITSNIQKQANYDSTNKVYADDLLAYLCTLKIDEALLLVAEQLADVLYSGQCPQGRCIRLENLCAAFPPELS